MGGLALLAREAGHTVSGSDANVYPPMSDQLREAGIHVREGYDPRHLDPEPDCVVIGNALSRGNPAVEHLLDRGLVYTSGPQWLAENLLAERWVLPDWDLDDAAPRGGYLDFVDGRPRLVFFDD